MLQAPQTSSQGQHCEVPEAHPATTTRSKTPELRRSGCDGIGGTGRAAAGTARGTHHWFPGGAAKPRERSETAKGPPPVPLFRLPVPEALGESQGTAPEQLIAKIGETEDYGAVSDREEMVAMTVSTPPRKPAFLQRERWAVQQAKLRGLSIRVMAREPESTETP